MRRNPPLKPSDDAPSSTSRPDSAAGEIPCAFVVLRDETAARESALAGELCDFVAQRLSGYKQPRDVRFVSAIPRNPSGKILRRQLHDLL